jgi:hypothetical protein
VLETTTSQDDPMRVARRMYQRVLVGWASDVLVLRAAGLDRPGHRRGTRPVVPGRARLAAPDTWTIDARKVA